MMFLTWAGGPRCSPHLPVHPGAEHRDAASAGVPAGRWGAAPPAPRLSAEPRGQVMGHHPAGEPRGPALPVRARAGSRKCPSPHGGGPCRSDVPPALPQDAATWLSSTGAPQPPGASAVSAVSGDHPTAKPCRA